MYIHFFFQFQTQVTIVAMNSLALTSFLDRKFVIVRIYTVSLILLLYKVTQRKITFFGGSQKSFFTPLGDMGNHLAFT